MNVRSLVPCVAIVMLNLLAGSSGYALARAGAILTSISLSLESRSSEILLACSPISSDCKLSGRCYELELLLRLAKFDVFKVAVRTSNFAIIDLLARFLCAGLEESTYPSQAAVCIFQLATDRTLLFYIVSHHRSRLRFFWKYLPSLNGVATNASLLYYASMLEAKDRAASIFCARCLLLLADSSSLNRVAISCCWKGLKVLLRVAGVHIFLIMEHDCVKAILSELKVYSKGTQGLCAMCIRRILRDPLAVEHAKVYLAYAGKCFRNVEVAVQHYTASVTGASFLKWSQKAQQSARLKRLCESTLLKMVQHSIRAAFSTWVNYSEMCVFTPRVKARVDFVQQTSVELKWKCPVSEVSFELSGYTVVDTRTGEKLLEGSANDFSGVYMLMKVGAASAGGADVLCIVKGLESGTVYHFGVIANYIDPDTRSMVHSNFSNIVMCQTLSIQAAFVTSISFVDSFGRGESIKREVSYEMNRGSIQLGRCCYRAALAHYTAACMHSSTHPRAHHLRSLSTLFLGGYGWFGASICVRAFFVWMKGVFEAKGGNDSANRSVCVEWAHAVPFGGTAHDGGPSAGMTESKLVPLCRLHCCYTCSCGDKNRG